MQQDEDDDAPEHTQHAVTPVEFDQYTRVDSVERKCRSSIKRACEVLTIVQCHT